MTGDIYRVIPTELFADPEKLAAHLAHEADAEAVSMLTAICKSQVLYEELRKQQPKAAPLLDKLIKRANSLSQERGWPKDTAYAVSFGGLRMHPEFGKKKITRDTLRTYLIANATIFKKLLLHGKTAELSMIIDAADIDTKGLPHREAPQYLERLLMAMAETSTKPEFSEMLSVTTKIGLLIRLSPTEYILSGTFTSLESVPLFLELSLPDPASGNILYGMVGAREWSNLDGRAFSFEKQFNLADESISIPVEILGETATVIVENETTYLHLKTNTALKVPTFKSPADAAGEYRISLPLVYASRDKKRFQGGTISNEMLTAEIAETKPNEYQLRLRLSDTYAAAVVAREPKTDWEERLSIPVKDHGTLELQLRCEKDFPSLSCKYEQNEELLTVSFKTDNGIPGDVRIFCNGHEKYGNRAAKDSCQMIISDNEPNEIAVVFNGQEISRKIFYVDENAYKQRKAQQQLSALMGNFYFTIFLLLIPLIALSLSCILTGSIEYSPYILLASKLGSSIAGGFGSAVSVILFVFVVPFLMPIFLIERISHRLIPRRYQLMGIIRGKKRIKIRR